MNLTFTLSVAIALADDQMTRSFATATPRIAYSPADRSMRTSRPAGRSYDTDRSCTSCANKLADAVERTTMANRNKYCLNMQALLRMVQITQRISIPNGSIKTPTREKKLL